MSLRRADRDLTREHADLADAILACDVGRACTSIERHFATMGRTLANDLTAYRLTA